MRITGVCPPSEYAGIQYEKLATLEEPLVEAYCCLKNLNGSIWMSNSLPGWVKETLQLL